MASAGRFSISACMAGSKRSRSLELQREAFGERAREHAGRLERLHRTSTRSTRSAVVASRSAISAIEPTKYPASSSASISAAPIIRSAGFGRMTPAWRSRWSCSETVSAHRPRGRAPRRRPRRPRPRPGADLEPSPGAAQRPKARSGRRRRRSPPRCRDWLRATAARSRATRTPSRRARPALPRPALRRLRALGLRVLVVLGALEQRIAGEFVLDEGGQLGIRHLQQLDRLKQLRREDHRLTLPHRQFGRKRHCTLASAAPRTLRANSGRRRGALFACSLIARSPAARR